MRAHRLLAFMFNYVYNSPANKQVKTKSMISPPAEPTSRALGTNNQNNSAKPIHASQYT